MLRAILFSRRSILFGLAASPMMPLALEATSLPKIVVNRDPWCGCCGNWVRHLQQSGFSVDVVVTTQINRVRSRLGVPLELASCHTAEIAEYVVEGHVPAEVIKRLVREKPKGTGLAVPGMPLGSPGMEVEGMAPEIYEVILFGSADRRIYARYRGTSSI